MFNRTSLGEISPILPIDFLIPDETKRLSTACRLVAPRTKLLLRDFPQSMDFRLKDGCVALYQSLGDGRRQILDILGPGSLLGQSIGSVAACKAETLTFTQIEPISAPLTDQAVGTALRELLTRAQALATLLGRKTAPEKVASAMLDLSERFALLSRDDRPGQTTFRLYLTRADLADWLGLTLETVCRCLGSFKRSGLIAFTHPEIITITDEDTLRLIAAGQGTQAKQAP
ncbi:helix-turn-helix domain-containing protein [Rhizobium sp. FY34]|uniref:Crp/Fnr family transcriptional regulator n=1 Tax=Rhizobium sp. FY34 TaxID=2562309 RepID=UPI001FEEF3B8|nr:helix-turn-helix domain-containing protein [Rhizobium sp. FY34]